MNQRIKKLQQVVRDRGVDALLISNPVDILYLSGVELSAGKLCVDTKEATLIVDGRYKEACSQKEGFQVVVDSEAALFKKYKKIGIDSDYETISRYHKLCQENRQIEFVELSNPVRGLRMVKDADEIKGIERACDLCVKGFDHVVSLLQEGITEKEVANELEIFWKRNGGQRVGFEPIIAFGANSSRPHYRAGKTKLKRHDIVLVDIGVVVDTYNSDMTRMVFFGKVDPELQKITEIVERAQKAAVEACRPGITTYDLDQVARRLITDAGYGDQYIHNLGHGVGLDIHEHPFLKRDPQAERIPLAPNMVITIEPGIYLPGKGGARIEDTVVVEQDGARVLTKRSTAAIIK